MSTFVKLMILYILFIDLFNTLPNISMEESPNLFSIPFHIIPPSFASLFLHQNSVHLTSFSLNSICHVFTIVSTCLCLLLPLSLWNSSVFCQLCSYPFRCTEKNNIARTAVFRWDDKSKPCCPNSSSPFFWFEAKDSITQFCNIAEELS